jgi:hypothetical protein
VQTRSLWPIPQKKSCDADHSVTWALITACARRRAAVGDAHALGVLSELMEHETAHVRASALEATYALSDPESPLLMEALSRSLEDGSILVRTAAQVQPLPFTEQHASVHSSCVLVVHLFGMY